MADIKMVLDRAATHGRIKQVGHNSWKAFSPLRSESDPSVSITYMPSEDKILINDFGDPDGNATARILDAWDCTFKDLEPESKEPPQWWEKDAVDKYRYQDEAGHELYIKVRKQNKDFFFVHNDGSQYVKGRGCPKILYRLPKVIKAVRSGRTVFIVEGEKDVHTLEKMGLIATTPGSTNDWSGDMVHYLIGARIVILPDNDYPGKQLAKQIRYDLKNIAFEIRTVMTSEADKGDVTDYIVKEEHTKADLMELISDADIEHPDWYDPKKKSINVGILAETVMQNNHFIVTRNPGTNSDQLLWYNNGVYHVVNEAETISRITPYIPTAISTPAKLKNIAQMITYNCPVCNYEDLNGSEKYINVKNGLLDVDSMKLKEHDSEVLSTIQLNCEYDERSTAPTWERYINDLCSDEDGVIDQAMRENVQRLVGLFFSPIHGYRIKRAPVLYSAEGNTGKSVLESVLTNIIGANNTANVSFQDLGRDRWAAGRCWGKRLITVGDQGTDAISDSSLFKSMTGGDQVSGEMKGLQHFGFTFTGFFLVACNFLPVFEDDKGSHMADRLLFLHCRNVIPKDQRDPYLVDKLLKEKNGIFLWALHGLKSFIEDGRQFVPCDSSDALMQEYRKRYDTLFSFVSDECNVTGNRSDVVHKTDFESKYTFYCDRMGFTPLSKRNISQRAASIGIVPATLDGYQVYRGVCFKW